MEETVLPLPAVRCLSKEQAAEYLGIGITLLAELDVPFTKLGRRTVYDKIDLDEWFNEYKHREQGRVRKDTLWPIPKKESTGGLTHASGGLQQRSQTAKEYAKVLGLKAEKMPKHC